MMLAAIRMAQGPSVAAATACPTCNATSGDDWRQCQGRKCPMGGPVRFDQLAKDFDLPLRDVETLSAATHGRFYRLPDGLKAKINDTSMRVWKAIGNDAAYTFWMRLREVTQP